MSVETDACCRLAEKVDAATERSCYRIIRFSHRPVHRFDSQNIEAKSAISEFNGTLLDKNHRAVSSIAERSRLAEAQTMSRVDGESMAKR
jgi:hypothetical protein